MGKRGRQRRKADHECRLDPALLGSEGPGILRAALRTDLFCFGMAAFRHVFPAVPFETNWHHEALAYSLTEVLEGKTQRLIVNLPPRSLKSYFASIVLPAFALGQNPSMSVVCVSYASDLALKHARDCRALMETPWYRDLFPEARINPQRRAEHDFMTIARGGRYAVSTGGAMTGRGGDLIIIDDPMKPTDAASALQRANVIEWAGSTLMSRANDKRKTKMVLVMQRLHDDDLTGHFMRQGGWRRLSMPAIATRHEPYFLGRACYHMRRTGDLLHPAYETPEVLEDLKRSMGSAAFAAQYQQDPGPPDSPHSKWAWVGSYDEAPRPSQAGEVWQSWDTAIKDGELNDYSVGITIMVKDGRHYILDVFRQKLDYPTLRRVIELRASQYPATRVLIEDKGAGSSLIQDLRRTTPLRPIPFAPEGDKVSRFVCQTAVIERGDVLLPRQAPWLEEFRRELLQFPHARNDDQVDALSQYLAHMDSRRRNRVVVGDIGDILWGRGIVGRR